MKYILTTIDTYNNLEIEFFNNKEEFLKFLENEKYLLLNTIDLAFIDEFTNKEAEFIAIKTDELDRQTEAYLRVVN